jgi:hypothetical protein
MTMNVTTTEAAAALADVLARENAGLSELDFARTGILAAEKEGAIAAFNRAVAALGDSARDMRGALGIPLPLARRLHELVDDNKRLLDRAIHVQGQVIACIARAAPRANGPVRAYGSNGAWRGDVRALPIALAARI